jgi:hypothetical protein
MRSRERHLPSQMERSHVAEFTGVELRALVAAQVASGLIVSTKLTGFALEKAGGEHSIQGLASVAVRIAKAIEAEAARSLRT